MVCYLERVKTESERVFAAHDGASNSAGSIASANWAERLTPLEERLKKLLASIPNDVISSGLSLDSLRRLLAGKWRGNCHPGELGEALRKLGYVRHRDWSEAEGGFRAKWFKAGI